MTTEVRLVSADSHIMEPPDLWQKRMPASLRDEAPRMRHMETRGEWWIGDDLVTHVGGALIQAADRNAA